MSYEHIALWSQVISAALFIAVFVGIWLKWIAPAVIAAQDSHNRQIAEAERHRDEAKAAVDALHHEIEGAGHDAEMIRRRAAEQGESEKEFEIAQARESGVRALRNARGELERARSEARTALRGELLDKALSFAQAEATRRVDVAMNSRLVDRFVSSLEGVAERGQ